MMDGATLRAGGVGCVERIRNPIAAARLVLDDSPHIYMVAQGAEAFAREHGIKLCPNSELVIDREVERWNSQAKAASGKPDTTFAGLDRGHDTVGAVALDAEGNIAAGTSTGAPPQRPVG